jgi:hypothetical protein
MQGPLKQVTAMRSVTIMSLNCTHTINGNLICVLSIFLKMHEYTFTFLYRSVTFTPYNTPAILLFNFTADLFGNVREFKSDCLPSV